MESQSASLVKIAIMGATGTGKSTFIKLLTNDDNIHIGHKTESETSDISTAWYTDEKTKRRVMLIDTPGYDDSRDGITDTDILQKIIDFLQPQDGEAQKLNGIIYVHRISDPRVGGLSRKNLRMFRKLCGEKHLRNVRIVTTYWDCVKKENGEQREADLKRGAFDDFLRAGAEMRRHANTAASAQKIVSELIPLQEFTTQLQDEIKEGKPLAKTGAGSIINEDLARMQKKHAEELANLRMEMAEAAEARDKALLAELEVERQKLESLSRCAEEDQKKLRMTLEELRNQHAVEMKKVKDEVAQKAAESEERQKQLKLEQVRARDESAALARRLEESESNVAKLRGKEAMTGLRQEDEVYRIQQQLKLEQQRAHAEVTALTQRLEAIQLNKARVADAARVPEANRLQQEFKFGQQRARDQTVLAQRLEEAELRAAEATRVAEAAWLAEAAKIAEAGKASREAREAREAAREAAREVEEAREAAREAARAYYWSPDS